MAISNVKLYEALRPKIGEEAARLIAEIVPASSDLATKDDIARLEQRIVGFGERIAELEARFLRWTLSFFVPLWLAVLGSLIAVVVKA